MWAAWHRAGLDRGTPGEVACIKNLINEALPAVDAAWGGILKGAGIHARLQGVVCHGHPWVKYAGEPRSCELGDFLLVHDHSPSHGTLQRRAAIVQAKVFHLDGVRAKNSVQLALYRGWPRFVYDSWPGGIKNLHRVHAQVGLTDPMPQRLERDLRQVTATRRARPSRLDDGSRYGMIDVKYSRWGDPRSGMNPWRMVSAQASNLYLSKDGLTLGGYLVRLMDGQVGRRAQTTEWPLTVAGACHWSLMISELLSILPNPTVSNSTIAYLAATPDLDLANMKPPSHVGEEPAEGGFGIIRIQTEGNLPVED